jgi:hypothetical protein
MPLAHLLWRLSEGRAGTMQVRVTAQCTRPSCAVGHLETDLRVCRRSVKILAARPITEEGTR